MSAMSSMLIGTSISAASPPVERLFPPNLPPNGSPSANTRHPPLERKKQVWAFCSTDGRRPHRKAALHKHLTGQRAFCSLPL